jgi:hypothetical protein
VGPAPSTLRSLGRLTCAVLGAVAIASFHAVGRLYYDGFRVPQGWGMDFLLPPELTHYALFFVFGLAAVGLLTAALLATRLPAAARGLARAAARRPGAAAAAAAAFVTLACLLLATDVLRGGVLTDDEHVYRFIAQTLRTGALTAPSPGTDLEFFTEQFVVVTDRSRYGKYPIGFPLLLAAGQILGMERMVVPVLTGLSALLLAWMARKEFSPAVIVLALALFVLSPQVLITGASLLSQPASAVCLLGALGCLLALGRDDGHPEAHAAVAGALLGYGILVRPLPGAVFAGVAIVWLAAGPWLGRRRRLTVRTWMAFLAPLACGPALQMWINSRQSGHPLQSGYNALHGPVIVLYGTFAQSAMSIASAVVRLNFWLFGWPLSLVLCLFARRTPATLLLWGMVAAEFAYRLIAPKAGIGTAGPLYFYEVVPLLCLLSADGAARLVARAQPRIAAAVPWPAVRADVLAAMLVSATIVSLSLFLPFKLADVARVGDSQQVVFRVLRANNVRHALVFHRGVVPPSTGLSWAYYPPPNSPRLDDDALFVLLQIAPERLGSNLEFWTRRFPDRQAWVFHWEPQKGPMLVPLKAFLRSVSPTPSPTGG